MFLARTSPIDIVISTQASEATDSDLPVIDEGTQVSLFDVGEPQLPL
ncbi:MAG: hypothetical protein ACPGSN_10290 [Psychrobium sp.]